MAILPLPVFEEELKAYEADKATYAALSVPKTLVVRFGYMKMVGEFPYQDTIKPGCGSKIVVRTHRGVEIGEMLTSTCPNSGCSKSVSRKEMLEYIQNSGGRDYPFFEHGRALRVATDQDMQEQARIEQSKHPMRLQAKALAERLGFPAKIVEVEPILGNDQVAVYYNSEDRVDFRELAAALQREWKTRIEMRQVGARDEARLTADYERCGQYCCCKNFLKVLKPVSMRSAKVQKATLDPLKISGRCGRLMCCLRYEDSTYEELRKKLPRNKSRVGTPEGDGMVIDSQILTQLVLVRLDAGDKDVAIAVEDLTTPVSAVAPDPVAPSMDRGRPRRDQRPPPPAPRDRAPDRGPTQAPDRPREQPATGENLADVQGQIDPSSAVDGTQSSDQDELGRRRRRHGRGDGAGQPGAPGAAPQPSGDRPADRGVDRGPRTDRPRDESRQPSREGDGPDASDINLDDIETDFGDSSNQAGAEPTSKGGEPRRRKRRRRRRGGPGNGPGGGPTGGGGAAPPPGPTGPA